MRYVARKRESPFRNHLYGTLKAAKEKIVGVGTGHARCAKYYFPRRPSPVNVKTKDHKKKQQNKRRRRPRRGSPRVDTTDVNAMTKAHKKR
jgi:hypothetical protein